MNWLDLLFYWTGVTVWTVLVVGGCWLAFVLFKVATGPEEPNKHHMRDRSLGN